MTVKIFNSLRDIFRFVNETSVPSKIGKIVKENCVNILVSFKYISFFIFLDIFAIPDYPVNILVYIFFNYYT